MVAGLEKAQNFMPEYASDSPVKIFQKDKCLGGSQTFRIRVSDVRPRYVSNVPQIILMNSQVYESQVRGWRKYCFYLFVCFCFCFNKQKPNK